MPFFPDGAHPGAARSCAPGRADGDRGGSVQSSRGVVDGVAVAGDGSPVADSGPGRCVVSGRRSSDVAADPGLSPVGLAPDRVRLQQHGLSAGVIEVMMGSRAESTSKLYAAKWSVFVGWCAERRVQPESCAVELILEFLRSMFDKGRAASTIRVYAAAISACHEGFPRGAVFFSHPYIKRFLKGCVRLRPVMRTVVPSWDLQLVLRALCWAPFEPLAQVPLKVLSMKTALLLALSSAKRVGDLCALSVSESCMSIAGDASRATLRPNAAFVPKVVSSAYRSRVIVLEGFSLPPHGNEEEERLHCLCRCMRS